MRDFDRSAAIQLFNELEFRSLIKELPGEESEESEPTAPAGPVTGQLSLFEESATALGEAQATGSTDEALEIRLPAADVTYGCVQDEAALTQLGDLLTKAERISFDVETTGTDAMSADLVGLGIAWAPGKAAYIPVGHKEGAQLDWTADVIPVLQPYFADPDIPKLAHNAKYDLTVCRRFGLDVAGPIHDTMVMAWLLDPSSRSLGLKAQAGLELGWEMTEIKELIGIGPQADRHGRGAHRTGRSLLFRRCGCDHSAV